MKSVWLALVAHGCAAFLPDPAPADGDQAPRCSGADCLAGLSATLELPDVIDVSGDRFAAAWSAAEGFSLSQLSVGGSPNLLFTKTADERIASVVFVPGNRAYEPITDPTVTVLASNPAVLRFRVEWLAADLSGATIHTVTPDARLFRDEDIQVHQINAERLSAYVGLDPTLFDRYASGAQELSIETGMSLDPGSGARSGCAIRDNQYIVGFGWSYPGSPLPAGPSFASTPSVALRFDWTRAGSPAPQLISYSGEMVTAVDVHLINPDVLPCAATDRAISESQDHLSAQLEGAVFSTGLDGDPDGDGFNEGGGFWQIEPDDGRELLVIFSGGPLERAATSLFRIGKGVGDRLSTLVYLDGDLLELDGDYLLEPDDGADWLYLDRRVEDGSELLITSDR